MENREVWHEENTKFINQSGLTEADFETQSPLVGIVASICVAVILMIWILAF